jgi:hypothetical protein
MNWKEFLKPTRNKILLVIVVLFITVLLQFLFICIGGRACPEGTTSYAPPFSCTAYPDCISESEADYLWITHNALIYFPVIIISYIASCLILNNRVKK